MKIEHLEVWNWQGLEHLCLTDFADRLNLIVGPNGAGKSRLFTALEAAFFEYYSGSAIHKMEWQTLGSQELPRVRLRFTIAGTTWTLEKQYVKKQFARISGGDTTLENDAAECKLQELIGSDGAGKRKPADIPMKGIWPLLWVPQHASHCAPSQHLNDASRGRLDDMLSAEAGVVSAGPLGDRVLALVNAEFARYYTHEKQMPTKDFSSAIGSLDDAEAELADAIEARDESRDQAERLAQDLSRLEIVSQELESVVTELDETLGYRKEAETYAGELENRESTVRVRGLELDQIQADLATRVQREQDHADVLKESQSLDSRLERARERHQIAEAGVKEAEDQVDSRTELFDSAQQSAMQAEQQAVRRRLTETLEKETNRLVAAEQDEEALVAVTRKLARLPIDENAYKSLETLDQDLRNARVALRAAAARVQVKALRDITLDGEAVPAEDTRDLVVERVRTLAIGDMVEVTIEPGGEDLSVRRQAVAIAESALRTKLGEFRVDTVAEAETQLDQRREFEREQVRLSTTLETRAPEGITLLRSQCEELRCELEGLGGPLESADETAPDAQNVRQTAMDAQDDLNSVVITRTTAFEEFSEARIRLSGLEASSEHLVDQLARLERCLSDGHDTVAFSAEVQSATDLLGESERQRNLAAKDVESCDLGDLETTCERLEKACRNKERERAQLKTRTDELRGILGRLDARELHEQVQEVEAKANSARLERDRIERRALAAQTLREALVDARDRTRDAVLSLVRDRVAPYLERVLPAHSLRVEEGWDVAGVRSADGLNLDFKDLSGGIKEQVALTIRFALAESLAGDGTLPIVLDDPLVHTDPERLKTMIKLLDHASRNDLQIIILSCDEADYSTLGEDRRFRLDAGGVVTVV